MTKAANANKRDGFNDFYLSNVPVILLRLVEPTVKETVNIESIMAGSAMEDIAISLLPPIPPKALPVSREDNARKNLPKANRYIIRIMSPVKFSGTVEDRTGTSSAIIRIETKVTYGVATKIHEAVSETTASFWSNLTRL